MLRWFSVALAAAALACGPSSPHASGSATSGEGESDESSAVPADQSADGTTADSADGSCQAPDRGQLLWEESFAERIRPLDRVLVPPPVWLEAAAASKLWTRAEAGILELSLEAPPRAVGGHHIDAWGPQGLLAYDHDREAQAVVVSRVEARNGSSEPLLSIDIGIEGDWASGGLPSASLATQGAHIVVFIAGPPPVGGLYRFAWDTGAPLDFVPLSSHRPTAHALYGLPWMWRDNLGGPMLRMPDTRWAYVWLRSEDSDAIVEIDMDTLQPRERYVGEEFRDFAVTAAHVYVANEAGLVVLARGGEGQTTVPLNPERVYAADDGIFATSRQQESIWGWAIHRIEDATLTPMLHTELTATGFDVMGGQLFGVQECWIPAEDDCEWFDPCTFDVRRSVWRL